MCRLFSTKLLMDSRWGHRKGKSQCTVDLRGCKNPLRIKYDIGTGVLPVRISLIHSTGVSSWMHLWAQTHPWNRGLGVLCMLEFPQL